MRFFSRTHLILAALALIALSGCSDTGVDAVNKIFNERATIDESDALYAARQKPQSLAVPLVLEYDEFQPELQWAQYSANDGLLHLRIPTGPAPEVILGMGERFSAGWYLINHTMRAVNVPAARENWLADVPLEAGVKVRKSLKGMDWQFNYTPAATHGGTSSSSRHKMVDITLERLALVDRESKKVYWERVFPPNNLATLGCDVPPSGTWYMEKVKTKIEMSTEQFPGQPKDWRNIRFEKATQSENNSYRLTSLDWPVGKIRAIPSARPEERSAAEQHVLEWDCKGGTMLLDGEIGKPAPHGLPLRDARGA